MPDNLKSSNNLEGILKDKDEMITELFAETRVAANSADKTSGKAIKVEELITDYKRDRELIKNKGLRQDIILKGETWKMLFLFLRIETVIIFIFLFFQAIAWPFKFHLEEWSFKLLILATISQITAMLLVAVKHLFPRK